MKKKPTIAASPSLFEMIMDCIPQAILFITHKGEVAIFNTSAEVLLQRQREKVLSGTFWDHFADDFFGFSMREALLRQDSSSFAASSSVEKWKAHATPIQAPEKGLLILVSQEPLSSENNRFLHELAHDIRSPLGGIRGFAALLEKDLEARPDLKKMASVIIKGTDRLNQVITDKLDSTASLKKE